MSQSTTSALRESFFNTLLRLWTGAPFLCRNLRSGSYNVPIPLSLSKSIDPPALTSFGTPYGRDTLRRAPTTYTATCTERDYSHLIPGLLIDTARGHLSQWVMLR